MKVYYTLVVFDTESGRNRYTLASTRQICLPPPPIITASLPTLPYLSPYSQTLSKYFFKKCQGPRKVDFVDRRNATCSNMFLNNYLQIPIKELIPNIGVLRQGQRLNSGR